MNTLFKTHLSFKEMKDLVDRNKEFWAQYCLEEKHTNAPFHFSKKHYIKLLDIKFTRYERNEVFSEIFHNYKFNFFKVNFTDELIIDNRNSIFYYLSYIPHELYANILDRGQKFHEDIFDQLLYDNHRSLIAHYIDCLIYNKCISSELLSYILIKKYIPYVRERYIHPFHGDMSMIRIDSLKENLKNYKRYEGEV
jgi:hypothetical protein